MSTDPISPAGAGSDVMRRPARPLPAGSDFVGRERELGLLERALRAASEGPGQIAMLAGEPGIGKTRLLDEIAARARALGAVVLWGACEEGQTGGAYDLFRQALDAYVRDAEASTLLMTLGAVAAVLAGLVSRLNQRFADLPQPAPLQPDEERTRLFDAVSQSLLAIGKHTPLVLILDDLHWADPDTVALLRHVLRMVRQQPGLLVIGAYRTAEVEEEGPLAEALAVVQRQPRFEPIRLKGLAAEEVAELLCTLPIEPLPTAALSAIDPALVEAVHAQTGGNPFFIRSLGRQLVEDGTLICADGRWQLTRVLDDMALPDGVRQVLRRQLNRLTPETQRFLTVAAVVGQSFRFDVVATVSELDEERALAVIDEGLATQLIRQDTALDTYTFRHALVRQTLYELLNPSRQVRLHRKIAEGMEDVFSERRSMAVAHIAQHYYLSRSLPGAERGVGCALEAADDAEKHQAYHEASMFIAMALELLHRDDTRRPRLLARRGLALAWALAFEDARQISTLAANGIAETEGPSAALQFLAEAVVAISNAGDVSCAFELARRGVQLAGATRDESWAVLMAADIIRREAEDPSRLGIAVDTPERREVARVFGRSIAGDAWSRHLLDPVAGSFGSRFWFEDAASREDLLRRGVSPAVFAVGLYREGLPIWYAVAETAERDGRIGRAVVAWASVCRFHATLGELSQALDAYRRGLALSRRLPTGASRFGWLLTADDDLRMAQDARWDQPPDDTDSSPFASFYRTVTAAAVARIHARVGRPGKALRSLEAVVPAIDRAPFWADNYIRICCDAAETIWLTRNSQHAEVVARNVLEKVIATDFRYPMCDGRLAMARLRAVHGCHEEAAQWFARARTTLDEQGARPLRAMVDYDEALMYARRGDVGDRERSLPLLEAALEQFRALGMPGWIRRAEHLLATGQEWSPPAIVAPPAAEPIDAPTAAAPSPTPIKCAFRLDGEFWTVTYEDKTVRLKRARGYTFLAALLREPGREIAATELVARAEPNGGKGKSPNHPLPGRGTDMEALRGWGSATPASSSMPRRVRRTSSAWPSYARSWRKRTVSMTPAAASGCARRSTFSPPSCPARSVSVDIRAAPDRTPSARG